MGQGMGRMGRIRWVALVVAGVVLVGCSDSPGDSAASNACTAYSRLASDQPVLTPTEIVEQAQRVELLASSSEYAPVRDAARAFAEAVVAGRRAGPASQTLASACDELG